MPLIRGRVVGTAGRPVDGVRLMLAGGPAPAPDIAMLSGPDGGFAMAVPVPGRWRLLAVCGISRVETDVDVAPDGADVVVALPEA